MSSNSAESISIVISIVYSSLCIILLLFVSFHAWSIVQQQKSNQFQQQILINQHNKNHLQRTIINTNTTQKRGKCCTLIQNIIPWFMLIWNMKTLYLTSLIHIYDIATDIGILIEWGHLSYLQFNKSDNMIDVGNLNMFELFIWSVIAFLLYRIISAFLIFKYTKSYYRFFLQLMDLEIYRCIRISHLLQKNKAGSLQRWLLKYEAIFESSPQAVLQLVYLINTKDFNNALIISSLLFSFFSVAAKFTYDDATFFNANGKSLGFGFNCCCNKKHRKKRRMKKLQNNNNNKHVCSCCLCLTFNIGYISRYLFRICDVFSRMLIFALIWTVTYGYLLMSIIMIEIILFLFISYKYERYNYLQYLIATYFDEENKSNTINWCFYRRIENLLYLVIIEIIIDFYPLQHHQNLDLQFVKILLLFAWVFSELSSNLFFDTYQNMLDGMQGTNERNIIKVIQNGDWDVFEEMLEFGYKFNTKYHKNISPLQQYMNYVPIINLYHVTKMCKLGSNIYDTTNDQNNDNPLTLYVKQKTKLNINNNIIDIDFNEIKQLLDYEKEWKLQNNLHEIVNINTNDNNNKKKTEEISLITHKNNDGKNAFQLYIDSMTSSITFYQVKKWYDLGADPIGMNSEGETPLEAYIKQTSLYKNDKDAMDDDDDDDDDDNDLQHDLQQLCHEKLPNYSRYNAFDIYLNTFKKINCDLIKMWKINQCINNIENYTDYKGNSIIIRYIKSYNNADNHKNNEQAYNDQEVAEMDLMVSTNTKSTKKHKTKKKVSFATGNVSIDDKKDDKLSVNVINDEMDSINGSSSDTFQMETVDDDYATISVEEEEEEEEEDDDGLNDKRDNDHLDDMIEAITNDTSKMHLKATVPLMNKFMVTSVSSIEGDNDTTNESEEEILYDDLPFDIPAPNRVRTPTATFGKNEVTLDDMKLLLQLGADCFIKDHHGMTAFHHYMKQKKVSFTILRAMIQSGRNNGDDGKYDENDGREQEIKQCDVNGLDMCNKTALMYYLENNEAISTQDLIELKKMGFMFDKDLRDIVE